MITHGDGCLDGDQDTVLGGVDGLLTSQALFRREPPVPIQHVQRVTNFLGPLAKQVGIDPHGAIV